MGVTENVPHVAQVRRRFKQPTGAQTAHVAQPNRTLGDSRASAAGRAQGEGCACPRHSTETKQGPRELFFVSPALARTQKQAPLGGGTCRNTLLNRDFRFAGPRWHLYTPESRRAHEILFGAQSCSSRGRHLSPRRRSTDWRPCFQGISQTPLHTCALSSPRGLRCTRPRVSLPALAAPRSSSACRRRAAGSDALLPAAASSTGHASRAGPRSSPAAAGDS